MKFKLIIFFILVIAQWMSYFFWIYERYLNWINHSDPLSFHFNFYWNWFVYLGFALRFLGVIGLFIRKNTGWIFNAINMYALMGGAFGFIFTQKVGHESIYIIGIFMAVFWLLNSLEVKNYFFAKTAFFTKENIFSLIVGISLGLFIEVGKYHL